MSIKPPVVTCRLVKRYFAFGKGYASAFEAYRAIAKRELGEALRCAVDADLMAQGLDPYSCPVESRENAVHNAMRAMFPPDSSWGNDAYGFDNDARQAWIRNRAKELAEQDELLPCIQKVVR